VICVTVGPFAISNAKQNDLALTPNPSPRTGILFLFQASWRGIKLALRNFAGLRFVGMRLRRKRLGRRCLRRRRRLRRRSLRGKCAVVSLLTTARRLQGANRGWIERPGGWQLLLRLKLLDRLLRGRSHDPVLRHPGSHYLR